MEKEIANQYIVKMIIADLDWLLKSKALKAK